MTLYGPRERIFIIIYKKTQKIIIRVPNTIEHYIIKYFRSKYNLKIVSVMGFSKQKMDRTPPIFFNLDRYLKLYSYWCIYQKKLYFLANILKD